MKLIKRIVPELLRCAFIAAFLIPFAWAATGDKISFTEEGTNSDIFRIDSGGRIIEAADETPNRNIELPLRSFVTTYSSIEIDYPAWDWRRAITDEPRASHPYLSVGGRELGSNYRTFDAWSKGGSASPALVWMYDPRVPQLDHTDVASPAVITFRVPEDFYASGTHGWKLLVDRSHGRYTYSGTGATVASDDYEYIDYDYWANADGTWDNTPVGDAYNETTPRALGGNNPDEVILTCPTSLAAGQYVTLRFWRYPRDRTYIGHADLRVYSVVFYYQSEY